MKEDVQLQEEEADYELVFRKGVYQFLVITAFYIKISDVTRVTETDIIRISVQTGIIITVIKERMQKTKERITKNKEWNLMEINKVQTH